MKILVCATAIFLISLLAVPSHADGINVITSSATIVEGETFPADITLSNQSTVPITVESIDLTDAFVSGDPTDIPTEFFFLPIKSCPNFLTHILPSESSCDLAVDIRTPSDVGESDADSGVDSVTVSLNYSIPGSTETFTASDSFLVTVNDALTPVPELSSLLFLSTGLLGLIAMTLLRKRPS